MIVRRSGHELLLITQPDHAALSGRLMRAWQRDRFTVHPLRASILAATYEHDNGWIEEDARPTVDPTTSRPYDFMTAPDEVRQRIWPRAVLRVIDTHPEVGALIAQHALTVYARYAANPTWQDFFSTLRRLRDGALTRSALAQPADHGGNPTRGSEATFQALREAYRFVYLGDLLSLMFCNGWIEPEFAEGYRVALRGDMLEISPDPFGGDVVPIEVTARAIPDRPYDSDDDLRGALERGREIALSGRAVGIS
jgi:hypothetical protein